MNRRGFLGNLLAGAAAIVGAGLAAPSLVRASEAPDTSAADAAMARMQAGMRTWSDVVGAKWGENVTVMPGSLTVTGNTTLGRTGRVINLGPGEYHGPIDLRGASNVVIKGTTVVHPTTIEHPTTFEAMQADFGPSYGGVVLTRGGQQVVCATGDEVIAALQDAAVVYREDVTVPPLRSGIWRDRRLDVTVPPLHEGA